MTKFSPSFRTATTWSPTSRDPSQTAKRRARTPPPPRRLKANDNVETKTLDRLCAALDCTLADIVALSPIIRNNCGEIPLQKAKTVL
ncbi:MAG: hypothetical protein E7609_04335 [Ruminococcaceae bacterium]|nr:hypothetical protein [Oscillospiraceae bacterium]